MDEPPENRRQPKNPGEGQIFGTPGLNIANADVNS